MQFLKSSETAISRAVGCLLQTRDLLSRRLWPPCPLRGTAALQFFRHEAEMWSWFHVLGLRLPTSPAAVVSFRNELDPDITLHLHYS